jgi:hypothetical protein
MPRWYCLTHGTKHMPCCPQSSLGAIEFPPEDTPDAPATQEAA